MNFFGMPEDFNLKYRPQKFADLDLDSLREGLAKVLKSGRVPQAFLLSGPRGTGKTSAARIIAKAVNCTNKEGFEPCNKCEQCRSITVGTNLDVLEIDAASSRGIDDIRDLREKIKLAPSFASRKVYIIDEVHMLTLEAFNALLKTLEEPPPHAIFVLCTTDPQKLPETIISRCMRFNLGRASQKEIMAKLQKIAQVEKIEIEKEALTEIAKNVKGSFRDANRILEQASMAGDKITLSEVKMILDRSLGFDPEKLAFLLLKKDAKAAVGEVNEVSEKGGNLFVYTEELLEFLRKLLLLKIGVTGEEMPSLEMELPPLSEITKVISLFTQAAREMRSSFIPQLPLEMAIAEYCLAEKSQKAPAKEEEGQEEEEKKQTEDKTETVQETASSGLKAKISLVEIQSRWQEVLLKVRPKNHSVEALLRATRPIDVQGKSLIIEVFYQFHKDRLEEEKCRRIIEESIIEIFQKPLFVKCVLGEKRKKSAVEEEIEAIKAAAPQPADNEVFDQDIIAMAEEIFNGSKD